MIGVVWACCSFAGEHDQHDSAGGTPATNRSQHQAAQLWGAVIDDVPPESRGEHRQGASKPQSSQSENFMLNPLIDDLCIARCLMHRASGCRHIMPV